MNILTALANVFHPGGAYVVGRLSFADEEGVKGISLNWMLLDQHGIHLKGSHSYKEKKRHPICHLPFSMSNSNSSLYCGSLLMQLISNLVVGLCVCVSENLQ